MAENLQHIVWSKMPLENRERKRPGGRFRPSIPFREDRSQHGAELRRTLEGSLQKTRQVRRRAGIDPASLIVLQMSFLEESQRDLLEKLQANIIEERIEELDYDHPHHDIEIRFSSPEGMTAFLVEEEWPEEASVHPVRASDGSSDPRHLVLRFPTKAVANAFAERVSEIEGVERASGPKAVRRETRVKLLVEFVDQEAVDRFYAEWEAYFDGSGDPLVLTARQRGMLFDALEDALDRSPEDRIGPRLAAYLEENPEFAESVYVDVDLWHPGNAGLVSQAIRQFRGAIDSLDARVTDGPTAVAGTLFIARVSANRSAIDWIASFDRTATVELPPQIEFFESAAAFDGELPASLPQPPEDGPLVCVVDSGIIAGHPLLDGLVLDEIDFYSGEDTVADQVGHGTHVAGVAVYGDIQSCLRENTWNPTVRVCSAKIMRRGPNGDPVFSDDRRIETQIRSAVEHFHREYSCRVFNLSIGDDRHPFLGGRQQALGLLLDELSRALDVVLVVPTGNVRAPAIPEARTTDDFRQALRDNLFSEEHRIIDPASAALALTVGGIAHTEGDAGSQQRPAHRSVVASPAEGPSPFTRSGIFANRGNGLHRSVKPELVAHGGNLKIGLGGQRWVEDALLGVPSLNYNFIQDGRPLRSAPGTSYSAPYVTHLCARLEAHLRREVRISDLSSNLIRALAVHSAQYPPATEEWLRLPGQTGRRGIDRLLRVVGYGVPDVERALYSTDQRVTLLSQDFLPDDNFHLYELEIPDDFVEKAGERTLRVTLAYDPPVRGTRQDYLARTLWFEVFSGLSAQDLYDARSNLSDEGGAPANIGRARLELSVARTNLQWSTVQSAYRKTRHRSIFDRRAAPGETRKLHLLVGSNKRFEHEEDVNQRYALVVTLSHTHPEILLHQAVRQQIRQRARAQVRV